jgi:hypothetical protein
MSRWFYFGFFLMACGLAVGSCNSNQKQMACAQADAELTVDGRNLGLQQGDRAQA